MGNRETPRFRAVILGADHPTGLGTARALRDLPVEIVGLARDPGDECCRSRVWNRIVKVDNKGNGTLTGLRHVVRDQGSIPAVIFPADDSMVKLLSENREEIERNFRFVLPERETVDLLLDKTAFHRWAIEHRFPVPASAVVHSYEEIDRAIPVIRYPFVLKPLFRTPGWEEKSPNHKIYKIGKPDDIAEIPFDLFGVADRYLVQEWIPGEDSDIHFCLVYHDRSGRERGYYTGRKIVQWRIGTGNTAICIGTDNDAIRTIANSVFKASGFHGLGSMEFKRSALDGRYYITEPTVGRNNLQSYVAVSGGVNLPRLAFMDAFGFELDGPVAPTRKAIWVHEKGLYYALNHLRKSGRPVFRDLLRQINGKKPLACAYADWRDPLPFCFMLFNMLKSTIKKSFGIG